MDGANERDRSINRLRDRIDRKGADIVAGHYVLIDGVEDRLIIHATQIIDQKTFNALPGHYVGLGQVVQIKDTRGRISHWLVTEVDFLDAVTCKGRIERCNRQLSWQSRITGDIVSCWVKSAKPYFSNLDSGKVVTASSREYVFQAPHNEDTTTLALNDRFLLEKINGKAKSYKITSIDTMTGYMDGVEDKGYLIINVEQDAFNPETDNDELMIADYVPKEAPPAAAGRCEIVYPGKPTLTVGGSAKTFTANFYSDSGDIIVLPDGAAPRWDIVLADEGLRDKFVVQVFPDTYSIKIRASNDYSLADARLRLCVAVDGTEYSAYVDLAVKAGW